jgi:hypothetical protein
VLLSLQLLTPPSEPCCALITPNPADSNILQLHLTACARAHLSNTGHFALFHTATFFRLLAVIDRLIYLLLYASSSGCAQLVVSSGRQTLHRQLKALMSWATFGASNPEEYRLREDFLTYCLLLLDSQPANAPPQLSDLSPIVSFLGKAQPPEGKVILAFSLKKYHLSPTRTTTLEVT